MLGDLWLFNLKTLCWSELLFEEPEMDFRRSQHAGCLMNNTLLVFGGKTHWSCEYSDKLLQMQFEYSD